MRIIVDADACPVKDIIEEAAKEYQIETIMVANINHMITSDYAKIIVVDGSAQAADIAIINLVQKGDLVVTQDYGLASLILAKDGLALGPMGDLYTVENIDILLMKRYLNQKARNEGYRIKGPHKRGQAHNQRFNLKLRQIIASQIPLSAGEK